jgi:short-subunit dehydrogenase
MPARLENSTVLLTGATGGIGRSIAHALHAAGATVVLTGRKADVLRRLSDELGDRADAIAADLSSRAGVERLLEQCESVDVLVANAALPATGRLDSFSADEVDRALDVNLRVPMHLARALVPGMMEREAGHIVLVSSLSGKIASARSSVYCATKFGLRGFGYSLNIELRGTGIGVTTVFPGFVREAGLFADSGAKLPPGVGTSSPQEVADAVVSGIEKDRVEIDVAPIAVRSSAKFFGAAPSIVVGLGRRLGGERMAERVAAGQHYKRSQ